MKLKICRPFLIKTPWWQADSTDKNVTPLGWKPSSNISMKAWMASAEEPFVAYPLIMAFHDMVFLSCRVLKMFSAPCSLPLVAYIVMKAFARERSNSRGENLRAAYA
ncbi:unnamed protein product [Linum trigynum]|uniref:Uncharacterized protein n=1 Tax=Linum trigynum TaxID=586398 RepID=A0AAV2EYD0_9ROSI